MSIDAPETQIPIDEAIMLRLDSLETQVRALTETQNAILSQIATVVEQVSPFLLKLENSPIYKMLGGKS
jgi:hypothetical protein